MKASIGDFFDSITINEMDGLILAGGLGTRLYPVTREIPKALIPVRGKPLTDHVFDVLFRAGVQRVVLSLGYLHNNVLDRYVPEFSSEGPDGAYKIETAWVSDDQNGTAAWIRQTAVAGLTLSDPTIVVNGDNLCNVDFAQVLEFHKQHEALATIVLTSVDDVSAFGVADLEGDRITRFVEKPQPEEAPSNLINTGYYIFSRKALELVADLFPADDDPTTDWKVMLEHHVFPRLAEAGGLYGFKSEGLWFDTGTFDRWSRVIDEWAL